MRRLLGCVGGRSRPTGRVWLLPWRWPGPGAVLPWGDALVPAEQAAEVGSVVYADPDGYLGDGECCVSQQGLGALDPDPAHERREGEAEASLQAMGEGRWTAA